jgi:hypothetical protein
MSNRRLHQIFCYELDPFDDLYHGGGADLLLVGLAFFAVAAPLAETKRKAKLGSTNATPRC